MPSAIEFASKAHGIRLAYPADWKAAPSKDYVLLLVPADAKNDSTGKSISLDVPKLPPHMPGMIPLGLVVNGYMDDLKKPHPGIAVEKPAAASVAGANARRVRSTWKSEAQSRVEDAVLTVHGDRVYIFRADSEAAEAERMRQKLEGVLATVTWK